MDQGLAVKTELGPLAARVDEALVVIQIEVHSVEDCNTRRARCQHAEP